MDSKKRIIVFAMMLVMFLVAFEGTVVTTAMPTIAKSLNGYNLISLVFSAYLLTSAVSTPIYGKLSDLFGRKKMLFIGIIIFLIGSALCGISQTMGQLVFYRAIQGLGAGAILTITYTIVGDLFTVSERTKVQGWLSTVWGIATLVGPFLGGFLIDYLSWHWIFFINIPFGIFAIYVLQRNLKETIETKDARIDFTGAFLLTVSIVTVLLSVFVEKASLRLIFLAITAVSLVIFYFVEKKHEEPIVPFDIFTRNTVIINLISFFIAGILMGIEAYSPIYSQDVLGFSPTLSGLAMAPMSISWLLSSFILAKALPKYGEKKIVQAGLLILIFCSFFLTLLRPDSSIWFLVGLCLVMGFGFGGIFTTATISVQTAVSPQRRGVSTSTNTLIRTLGQTIFVSIFGGISTASITRYFTAQSMPEVTPDNIYHAGASSQQIKEAFYGGLHNIFILLFIFTVVCFVISIVLKDKKA